MQIHAGGKAGQVTEHFAQIAASAAIILAFAAALVALSSWWRALVVAVPLLAAVPWGARSYNGEPMAVTALVSSAALVLSLFAARRIGPRKALIVVAFAAVAAVVLARRTECWSAPMWYQSVHGEPFNLTERDYGAWWYPALAFALLPLLLRHRRAWWYPVTAAWGALVCLMTIVFGIPAYVQHSPAMQAGLVVTLGIGALQNTAETGQTDRGIHETGSGEGKRK